MNYNLTNDKKVPDILKIQLIRYMETGEKITTKEEVAALISSENQYILTNYTSLKESIEYIKNQYSDLFYENSMMLREIYKIVALYESLNNTWITMTDDEKIPEVYSRLIAFWLSSFRYNKLEKETYFNEIYQEIKQNSPTVNANAVANIKENYTILYKFKKSFFDNLINELEREKTKKSHAEEMMLKLDVDTSKAGGFFGLFKKKK